MQNEIVPTSYDHVDILDGLRGLAIALVVWFHLWQFTWLKMGVELGPVSLNWSALTETGFLGVELFFFLSGFCLFHPYARHLFEGRPLQTIGHYAHKRAIKILPSYWLSLGLMLAWLQPDLSEAGGWAWNLVTHAFFIHNWFGDTQGAINGVLWSLGVEVQFYLLFPLVCWAFRRRPLAVWAATSLFAIGYRHVVFDAAPTGARFLVDQLPGYLDLFLDGMLASYLIGRMRSQGGSLAPWRPLFTTAAVVMLACLFSLVIGLYDGRQVDGWPATWLAGNRHWLGLGLVAFTATSFFAVPRWRRIVAWKPLVFLSTISYNLYLWHQVIARWLFDHAIPMPATPDPHDDPRWQLLFTALSLGLSLAVASAITYGFERPLLRHGVRGLWHKLLRRAPAGAPLGGIERALAAAPAEDAPRP